MNKFVGTEFLYIGGKHIPIKVYEDVDNESHVHGFDHVKPKFKPRDSVGHPTGSWK